MKNYELSRIKENIERECVSTAEILYLQEHKASVLAMGDPVLCAWAGVNENEYKKGELK